jgi:DNA helicase-2/ATP-dependent DNA helicase PcrA
LGTADPADVALMAHDFLMSNPDALHSVRSKLRQIVVDEYQDVSVSQHKLLRLIILGAEDEEIQRHAPNQRHDISNRDAKMPILLGNDPIPTKSPRHDIICYHVPKIICAGDSNQSIYGWRGAAPSLTVEGFRNDFPQGLVVPLGTNYRLPRHILNAANVLLGQEQVATQSVSYDVSPAAAMSISDLVEKHQRNYGVEDRIDSGGAKGQQLLLEEGLMEESRSSVFIQGLWDQREEAKFIAAEIRKRSKERSSAFAKILRKFEDGDARGMKEESFFDSTDVAIMVRSSSQLKLIEEALKQHGIPSLNQRGSRDESTAISESKAVNMLRGRQPKQLAMKPVRLITMHKAKGDEFDDVYLAGWTEGVFPHPSSLSTNRVHEERRIAYVALTRARQIVVITYAFMKRVSYFGSNGSRKEVTEPVEPSRFLYDLTEEKAVKWSDSYGFKECVAGRDLPDEYANSYKIPSGYTKNKVSGKLPQSNSNDSQKEPPKKKEVEVNIVVSTDDSMIVLLNEVLHGLDEIFARKRGSRGKYKKEFRCLLKEFGINRGSALILTKSGEKQFEKMATALVSIPDHFVTTRQLSRCTAEQLGLYFVYLLHQEE